MFQDIKMHQVSSFQIFVRDNKGIMNAYYPFLSQDQIMSKLRQRWRQLDETKRRSYSKLVVSKTKSIRKIKTTRRRCPHKKALKLRSSQRTANLFMNDDSHEFDSAYDSSNFVNTYEFDSSRENSPFMKGKLAIDCLNASSYFDRGEEGSSFCGVGKTYSGRVFEPHHKIPNLSVQTEVAPKTGILRILSKDQRTVQSHVCFSASEETIHTNEVCSDLDDDLTDEQVLCIESTHASSDVVSDDTESEKKTSCRVKSHLMEDHKPEHTADFEEIHPVKEAEKQEPEQRKISTGTVKEHIALTSSNALHSHTTKKVKMPTPGSSPRAALNNEAHKSPVKTSEICRKPKLSTNISPRKVFYSKTKMLHKEKTQQSLTLTTSSLASGHKASLRAWDSAYGKLEKDMPDKLFFLSDKDIKQEYRLSGRLQNKSHVANSALCNKVTTKPVQAEDYKNSNGCLKSLPSYLNQMLAFHKPLSICTKKPVQKNSCYTVQADMKEDASKKSGYNRKCSDSSKKGANKHETRDEDNVNVSKLDEESKYNNYYRTVDKAKTIAHSDHKSEVSKNLTYHTKGTTCRRSTSVNVENSNSDPTDLPPALSGRTNTLEQCSQASEEHHKSDPVRFHKMITRNDKAKCLSKLSTGKDCDLDLNNDLSQKDMQENKDPNLLANCSLMKSTRTTRKRSHQSETTTFHNMVTRNDKTKCFSDPAQWKRSDLGKKRDKKLEKTHEEEQQFQKLPANNTIHELEKYPSISCKTQNKQSSEKYPVSGEEHDTEDYSDSTSENDQVAERRQSDFSTNMADQTTSVLLQAIERLQCLTSPQNCLINQSECDDAQTSDVTDSESDQSRDLDEFMSPTLKTGRSQGQSYRLDQGRNQRIMPIVAQHADNDHLHHRAKRGSLCLMFQDVTRNTNRKFCTPAKRRLLSSSVMETPSNFMDMFDNPDIFL